MRLQGLALCLLLVACGGSSKHARTPESATTTAPGGGTPTDGAATAPEPVEAAKPADMPPAAAPAPMATESKAAPKPKTRGAQKKGGSKDEDPDAGGE